MTAINIVLNLAKKFEGCNLRAYWDDSGKCWTVGYGCTGREITENTVWTQAQADAKLTERMEMALHQALTASPSLINAGNNRQAAIADFIFNCGFGIYTNSRHLKPEIDDEDWESAALTINLYAHANGKTLPGLIKRRAAESDLLLYGD
jgi:lysozyme